MASLVHKFAYECDLITANVISAVHFVELARAYQVMGTPHTVINGIRHVRGRVRAEQLLAAVLDEVQSK
jgi:hypothetical protein